MNNFTSDFDRFACIGDTISCESDGFDIEARIVFDDQCAIDDDDSHNVDQSVTGCNDEQQERLLAARKAWFNDEWCYVGIVLSVSRNGVCLTNHASSLWGLEMNYPAWRDGNPVTNPNEFLTDMANELLPEALDEARAIINKLIAD